MARVNVETRALAEQRFSNLSDDLEMTRAETIGMLVIFWHDSQERGIWHGTREEVSRFIPFKREQRSKCFQALLDNEYISPMDGEDDLFVIHGNRKHVEALTSMTDGARQGGIRSGEARRKKPKENKGTQGEGSEAEGDPSTSELNTIQFNAVQSNATQGNSVQNTDAGESADGSAPGPSEPDLDFEALYRLYPRKIKKTDAIDRMRRLIKSPKAYQDLSRAIEKFRRHHTEKRTQEQYLPYMTSFLGVKERECWRDWLDPETGTADVPGEPQPNNPAYRRMAGNQHALAEYQSRLEGSGGGES
jgi:hypothetical protein